MRHSTDLYRTNAQAVDEPLTLGTVHGSLAENPEDTSMVLARASDVLKELHALLEDYAPMWFTEVQHKRTENALHELNRLIPSRPVLSIERNL